MGKLLFATAKSLQQEMLRMAKRTRNKEREQGAENGYLLNNSKISIVSVNILAMHQYSQQ